MGGLRGHVREPRETPRGRRNSANLASNVQFISAAEVIAITDDGFLLLTLDSPSGLENNAGKLRIDVEDSSLLLSASGIKVQLATDPGLELSAGVRVKANAAKGITRESAGVGVLLDTDPGLEFDGTNGLGVKIKADGGVVRDSTGLSVTSQTRFTQTATATVANTVTETTLIASGVGSVTLPAAFLVAGRTVRLVLRGVVTATGADTVDLKVKLGGTTLVSTGAVTPAAMTDEGWEITVEITCRTTGATGTVFAQGMAVIDNVTYNMAATTTTTVNTTGTLAIDATATWGVAAAGNDIRATNAIIESLN